MVVIRTNGLVERFIINLVGEYGIFGKSIGQLHFDMLMGVTVVLIGRVCHFCLLVRRCNYVFPAVTCFE